MSYSDMDERIYELDVVRAPQSEFSSDFHNSYPSRTIVSDDDDNISIVGDLLSHHKSNGDTKLGSPSSNTYTTFDSSTAFDSSSALHFSSAFDDVNQDIPLCQDTKKIIARTTATTTTKAGANNGNNSELPICPPLLTGERKTALTIQPRNGCAQNSPLEILVDEYEFKSDCTESSTRQDFNTCGKPEDFSRSEARGIHENRYNSNNISESVVGISRIESHKINTESHKINSYNETSMGYQHRHQTIHHPSENLHNNDNLKTKTKMPSKSITCLPRQRSRAIAIKRSRPGDHFIGTSPSFESPSEKEARRCDVELYDYATWRMYNRIIDHRRKNLLRIQLQDHHRREEQKMIHHSNLSSTANHASASHIIDEQRIMHPPPTTHGHRGIVHRMPHIQDDSHSGSEDDDQIFDLEL